MTERHNIGLEPRAPTIASTADPLPSSRASSRPHFRLDWRQLTYEHGPSKLDWLFGGLSSKRHEDITRQFETDQVEKFMNSSNEGGSRPQTPDAFASSSSRKKRILNSLDGHFKSGELSAILGPSGAGKSSFLSAMFGSKQDSASGQTRVSWFADRQHTQPIEKSSRTMKVAFLPQHDHLLHHLTVYECLMFASKIKNPHIGSSKLRSSSNLGAGSGSGNGNQKNASFYKSSSFFKINGDKDASGYKDPSDSDMMYKCKDFHKYNVKKIAKMLKLTDCLDTRCGKLSGGQYKRVSIGQELLSDPDIIILDEPTSGLDAMTCLSTVQTLRSIIVKHPMSIILTIHQPDRDVFRLFDQVYVIAQGGMAIYEGPPNKIMDRLATVGIKPPNANCNPARVIVELAFVSCDSGDQAFESASKLLGGEQTGTSTSEDSHDSSSDESEFDDDDDDDNQQGDHNKTGNSRSKRSLAKLSLQSITDSLKGANKTHTPGAASTSGSNLHGQPQARLSILNGQVGFVSADGKIITTSEQLKKANEEKLAMLQLERWNLLKRLNRIQKSQYYDPNTGTIMENFGTRPELDSTSIAIPSNDEPQLEAQGQTSTSGQEGGSQHSANESATIEMSAQTSRVASPVSNLSSETFTGELPVSIQPLNRHFDKQLSSKRNTSASKEATWYHTGLLTHRTWLSVVRDPVFFGIQTLLHTVIPIILGSIFIMHQNDGCPKVGHFDVVEFAYSDSNSTDLINESIDAIRETLGNIGVIFFEMFVLCFAINCITALVFPADMFVLLKEYRNGWYSMFSYFMGRTLADLPVPVMLHSIAMLLILYLTDQPLSFDRTGPLILLVVLATLVAQSVGLTMGAILMQSSQSAVLAAAGITTPFFALSGFIVRVHLLPWFAQISAKTSYLYYLLNGFIILRYGFGRCPCKPEDFDKGKDHQLPQSINTMASIWVGTFAEEYRDRSPLFNHTTGSGANSTSEDLGDPNIDIVGKLMEVFKSTNSFGHKIETCDDALPYSMLDFNLRDDDIYTCFAVIIALLIISRSITFAAIYYKVRSFL